MNYLFLFLIKKWIITNCIWICYHF